MTLRRFAAIILLVALVPPALLSSTRAEGTGTIEGYVRGIYNSQSTPFPIHNATVHAISENVAYLKTTALNGNFSFENIPTGIYTITVTAPGFLPENRTATLNSDAIVMLAIILRSQPNALTVTVYPVQQNVTAGNNVTYLIIVSSTLPTNLTLQISAETNSTQLTLQTRSPSNSSILAEGKMRIARLQVFAAPEAAPGNYTITLLVTVTGAEQTLTSSRQLELQVISSKNAFATPTALTTCIIILGVIVIIAIAYMALRSRKRASRKRLQN